MDSDQNPHSAERLEAMAIEGKAWELIKAFDDQADTMQPLDRRIPYAAMILMMTSFIKTSQTPSETILDDFRYRVTMGVDAVATYRG